MNFNIVIPARYASTRLKGKLLKKLADKPILQWAWEASCASSAKKVYIATDSELIFTQAQAFGAEVLMTSSEHTTGTDRLAEAAQILGLSASDILVNVQGDEPLIDPILINQVAENLQKNTSASIASLYAKIHHWEDFINPNVVKVITDKNQLALSFSRAPIPYPRELLGVEFSQILQQQPLPKNYHFKRHLGIYAYRAEFLQKFNQLQQGQLEVTEHLEQLRALENGYKIHLDQAKVAYYGGIDTQEDLDKLTAKIAS